MAKVGQNGWWYGELLTMQEHHAQYIVASLVLFLRFVGVETDTHAVGPVVQVV